MYKLLKLLDKADRAFAWTLLFFHTGLCIFLIKTFGLISGLIFSAIAFLTLGGGWACYILFTRKWHLKNREDVNRAIVDRAYDKTKDNPSVR